MWCLNVNTHFFYYKLILEKALKQFSQVVDLQTSIKYNMKRGIIILRWKYDEIRQKFILVPSYSDSFLICIIFPKRRGRPGANNVTRASVERT